MVRWVIGSILHSGPIELFLIPVSGPRLMYVLACLLDDAYKITVAAKRKEYPVCFLSHYLNGPLPYVRAM